jgi:hypothetical protein
LGDEQSSAIWSGKLHMRKDESSSLSLKQNQSKRALVEGVQGGFFLRKKPLGGVASGYSYSGFAVAGRGASSSEIR